MKSRAEAVGARVEVWDEDEDDRKGQQEARQQSGVPRGVPTKASP